MELGSIPSLLLDDFGQIISTLISSISSSIKYKQWSLPDRGVVNIKKEYMFCTTVQGLAHS